jgi:hypothetical protein
MNIEIPESPRCGVIGVSFRMRCFKCGLVWDIYVSTEDCVPPDLWDVCRNCLAIIEMPTKDTSTKDKYVYKYAPILVKYPYLNHG